MWMIGLIALMLPVVLFYAGLVTVARHFGPGPLGGPSARGWWTWPIRPRVAPFSGAQRRMARRVLYPIGEVEGLTWAQQRVVYWRVRRFPDRRYAGSVWTAALLGTIVVTMCGLALWGCGFTGATGLMRAARGWSRPVQESWIGYAAMLPFAIWLVAPLIVGALAAIGQARSDARDAIRRYVGSRLEACDRCRYPLDARMAVARPGRDGRPRAGVVRCPECGLGHDLRWRSPARSPGRWRKRAARDGPMLLSPRRAARVCRGVASLRGLSEEQCARLMDHGLWVDRGQVTAARIGAACVSLSVGGVVTFAMWPAIEGALGAYVGGRLTGSQSLSVALALPGPAAAAAVWLWMDSLLLRWIAGRAAKRKGPACATCGYSLEGLPVGATGLVACPECGVSGFPSEGESQVVRAEDVEVRGGATAAGRTEDSAGR